MDVLVVDDDFMVARINRGFVEKVPGFRVVGTVHSGREAVEAAERLRPDLVLLDIYLPDLHGIEVLRAIRERAPEVDVLVITAARESATVLDAMRGGAVHYLIKPFAFDDLRTRLEHFRDVRGSLGEAAARQADVDRVFGTPAAPPVARGLPKGLSAETAELVRGALRAADRGLSAAECAAELGVSRVSARRYLEHFASRGQAVVRLRYGTTGRPERRYHWQGTGE
ncbi:response regulator [Allostreptomyces psammosilenae]|uniref:Transcriptional regulatory protein n=1 Tax=Allostreptomyces psammosilenae TaxID=1892865 RepID=A0A852ZRQ9_9ACTN|nr:response regulator [Allostreptomyces psammosilenae]NYI03544.1 response regulator of citrate/malate metabolism [Allostreptomyces psammosilenae]